MIENSVSGVGLNETHRGPQAGHTARNEDEEGVYPFAEFSEDVKRIARRRKAHWSRRWFWGFVYIIVYTIRNFQHDPLPFKQVNPGGGKPVGGQIAVQYPPVHDMMPDMALGRMTDHVLLGGVEANAFWIADTVHVEGGWTTAVLQPCWVDPALPTDPTSPPDRTAD